MTDIKTRKISMSTFRQDTEYGHMYCKDCHRRINIPVGTIYNYGKKFMCFHCKVVYLIVKPKPIEIYCNSSIECKECQHNPCTCGYLTYITPPPHMSDGILAGVGKSFNSLRNIEIRSTVIGSGSSNRSNSAWNTYMAKSSQKKRGEDEPEFRLLDDSPAYITVTMKDNTIYGKMETYLLKIIRAFLTDKPPVKNYRYSNFTITGDGSRYEYDMDERTIRCKDPYLDITLKLDENLIPTVTRLKEYWNGGMNERKFYSQCIAYGAGRLASFIRMFVELTGIKKFKTPAKMQELTGNWRWADIEWVNLHDISVVRANIIIDGQGSLDPGTHQRTTSRILITKYQSEFGYQHSKILNVVKGWGNPSNQCYMWWAFSHRQHNKELYETFKKLMVDPQHLIDYANKRRDRLRNSGSRSDSENKLRKLYEDELVNHVLNLKESKCLFCGGSVHNIRAFKNLKSVEMYEDHFGKVGALCCGCYGKARRDGLFEDRKKIIEELKANEAED